ncbi:MAG: hypothetical protein Q7R95_06540 [bacterium]|nr:hypothetical protein [bacterium]
MKNWLKQNWVIACGIILILLTLSFINRENKKTSNTATVLNNIVTLSEDNENFIALEKSLPRFEDYPVKVYPIPPKPIVDHNSHPYAMRFWTSTNQMIDTATDWSTEIGGGITHTRTSYDMGGHYLMDRHGTGNPQVFIIDGLTGKLFNEYGGYTFLSKPDSSLVIFNNFDINNFTSSGDYDCKDGQYGCDIRYAQWNGEQFITICEPVVKNWKVVSCGEVADKTSDFYGKRKVLWSGTVITRMTYGRLRIKLNEKESGYSEFVAEPNDVDDTPARASKTTANINNGDLVEVIGYWENENSSQKDIPWVFIEKIDKYYK